MKSRTRATLLCVEETRCRVGLIDAGRPRALEIEPPAEADAGTADPGSRWGPLAAAVAETLRSRQIALSEIVLAIPSAWCLCGRIEASDKPTDRRPRRDQRESLLYELEEYLPVVAEDVVADYLPCERGWFCVAIQQEKARPLVEALETEGLTIATICPFALLASQSRSIQADALVIGEDRPPVQTDPEHDPAKTIDLIWWERGRPAGWCVLPEDARDIGLRLAPLLNVEGDQPPRLVTWGLSPDVVHDLSTSDRFQSADWVEVKASQPPDTGNTEGSSDLKSIPWPSVFEAATELASDILRGRSRSIIELMRKPLPSRGRRNGPSKALKALAVAAGVFLLFVIGAALYGANRYDRQAEALRAQQRDILERVLPDARLSGRVARRLESEWVRLRQDNTAGSGSSIGSKPASALTTLASAFDRLPDSEGGGSGTDVTYRLDRIIIDGQQLRLEGETDALGTAGVLAVALSQDAAWRVQPPRTQARSNGQVSFVILGQLRDQTPGEQP